MKFSLFQLGRDPVSASTVREKGMAALRLSWIFRTPLEFEEDSLTDTKLHR